MEDMGDMEMDMESLLGGGGDKVKSTEQSNVEIVVLTNIEQSSRALQQMGMILSEFSLSTLKASASIHSGSFAFNVNLS